MSKLLDPVKILDYSKGRITKYSVSPLLMPANSVSNAINVDFSEVIGSGIVRKGNTSKSTIAYNGTTDQQQLTITSDFNVYDVNQVAQTFTVSSSGQTIIGVMLSGRRTGTPATALRVELQQTTAGAPNGNVLSSIDIPQELIGTVNQQITAVFLPASFQLVGAVLAIVVSATAAPDAGNSYQIRYNTAGGYASGSKYTSSDGGTNWTISTGEDLFFIEYVRSVVGSYDLAPLGFQAGVLSGSDYGVVVYTTEVNSKTVLFWSDSGTWRPSNLQDLSSSAMNRFAVLNGSIFRVSSARAMDYSDDFGETFQPGSTNNITITEDSVVPSLVWVNKNRMLASGYSAFPSRIYFSSIVEPNSANFIRWNTDPDDGDWIDVNPDDGGNITGFSDTSNLLLVFKNNAMYRLNTINKTVDSENIFNIGAVSQECIVKCLGLTYFFSGNGIYRTDGGFPELISRLGVQDFIDNLVGQSLVTAGTDGFNVYFSIGNVTLKVDDENKVTYSRVVLKFSPRDENWSVFTYSSTAKRPGLYSQFRPGQRQTEFWNAQYNGDIGYINYEGTDNQDNSDYGGAIPYFLESQELDMGNRAHTKVVSDKIVVFTKAGTEGQLQMKGNGKNFKTAVIQLNERVSVGNSMNITGEYFTYRWQGEGKGARPILQGIHLPTVTDLGIVKG